ncbi:urocanate reductase [Ligilactobacillus pabuli]|uniref:Urocanate reductase n=1 Tax=Ligilactobacillus pabuli TaxID=2886039 RepID=A0ABQ5JIM7_9LACO|nr:flavocytochrome c [Ligilactobacillus pabuli]GKS81588.1 urocanate reductase [Ligilactobacillus pabuli]
MKAGKYIGKGHGFAEDLEFEVSVDEDKIIEIKFLRQIPASDNPSQMQEVAVTKLSKNIIVAQSLAVDAISGATASSNAVKEAVKDAVIQAGGDPAKFEKSVTTTKEIEVKNTTPSLSKLPDKWDVTYDVVTIGGGFACLAAAHRAAQLGASTVVVEKMPMIGGNSQINGGVYAAYTSKLAAGLQKNLNLKPDTAEKHIKDTLAGGDFMGDPKLVKNLVYGSPFYLNLLLDNGLEVRPSLTRPGGHYGYRTYTMKHGVGSDIVKIQKKLAEEAGAQILVNTKLTQIYREPNGKGAVVGIRVDTEDGPKTIRARKGVILATGGFSANVAMRTKQVPYLTADLPTTNHVGATGEGLTIAQEIGANTMQMSYIQLFPFADPNNGVLDAYAVIPFSGPSSGIIYVDINGKRYVNEGERRDVCSKAAQDSAGFPTFSIFGQKIVDNDGFIAPEQLKDGLAADRIFKADTIKELVDIINEHTYKGHSVSMNADDLNATIKQHNGYIEQGQDPDFGKVIDKEIMIKIEEGPYYAIPQWPSIHHTMGGITINEKTEVEDIWGKVIPHFYAAGEVTGGVHGTNRLGSNAIPDCCVHGYIAGQMATNGTLPDFIPRD